VRLPLLEVPHSSPPSDRPAVTMHTFRPPSLLPHEPDDGAGLGLREGELFTPHDALPGPAGSSPRPEPGDGSWAVWLVPRLGAEGVAPHPDRAVVRHGPTVPFCFQGLVLPPLTRGGFGGGPLARLAVDHDRLPEHVVVRPRTRSPGARSPRGDVLPGRSASPSAWRSPAYFPPALASRMTTVLFRAPGIAPRSQTVLLDVGSHYVQVYGDSLPPLPGAACPDDLRGPGARAQDPGCVRS
jgi:hypothetical protein